MAALAVCLYHSATLFGQEALLPHAYIAVDFFFVLSGFILFHRYGRVLDGQVPNPAARKDYLLRRFARLYPLFGLAMLIGFLLTAARLVMHGELVMMAPDLGYALVSGLLVLPVASTGLMMEPDVLFPLVSPAWSIFWEIILSILFVFWAWARLRHVALVAVLALVALIVCAMPLGSLDGGWRLSSLHVGGLRAIAGFTLGILCAKLYSRLPLLAPPSRHLVSAVVLGLVVFVGAYMALGVEMTSLWLELVFLAVLFPAIVVFSAWVGPPFLANRLGILLGNASYSLYLLHTLFRDAALFALRSVDVITPSPLIGLAWLLITLAGSYFCWRWFEVPARVWLTSVGSGLLSGLPKPSRPRSSST